MQRNEDCKQSERSSRPRPLTRVSVNIPTDDTQPQPCRGVSAVLRGDWQDRESRTTGRQHLSA